MRVDEFEEHPGGQKPEHHCRQRSLDDRRVFAQIVVGSDENLGDDDRGEDGDHADPQAHRMGGPGLGEEGHGEDDERRDGDDEPGGRIEGPGQGEAHLSRIIECPQRHPVGVESVDDGEQQRRSRPDRTEGPQQSARRHAGPRPPRSDGAGGEHEHDGEHAQGQHGEDLVHGPQHRDEDDDRGARELPCDRGVDLGAGEDPGDDRDSRGDD